MIENKKIFYIKNKLRCVYYYEKRAHIRGVPDALLRGKSVRKRRKTAAFCKRCFRLFCNKMMFIVQIVRIKCLLCKNHALFSSWKRASA